MKKEKPQNTFASSFKHDLNMTFLKRVLVLAALLVSTSVFSQCSVDKQGLPEKECVKHCSSEELGVKENPIKESRKEISTDKSLTIHIRKNKTITLRIQRKIRTI